LSYFILYFSSYAAVQGLNWEIGAISNATWSGARLTDVLQSVGITRDTLDVEKFQHVQFEGLDSDIERHYGASIPVKKACDWLVE
jgi:sulfite oxidase